MGTTSALARKPDFFLAIGTANADKCGMENLYQIRSGMQSSCVEDTREAGCLAVCWLGCLGSAT